MLYMLGSLCVPTSNNVMKQIEILIVDDDSDDVELFQEVLNESDLNATTIAFFDPDAAFGHLQNRVDRREKLPDLVVMDLNMPRMQGHEALSVFKATDAYHRIPVIVISVSKRAEDSEKSFLLGAAGYFIKPLHPDEWKPVINLIRSLVYENEKKPVD